MPAPIPSAARARDTRQSNRSDELIVRVRPTVDPAAFASAVGLRLHRRQDAGLSSMAIYRFVIADGSPPDTKAAQIITHAGVISAEPNYIGQVPEAARRSSWVVGSDAGGYAGQWAAERIGLPAAHAISAGEGVTVAVLDTGVDRDHPALAGRLTSGYDFIDGDDTPYEGAPEGEADDSSAIGHGTHVAALVALTAPAARIMPLRTLDSDGLGDLWDQLAALRYAVDHGATVVNLSFSFGQRSPLFDSVVAEVSCSAAGYQGCRGGSRPGAVVVAAAGNSGERARAWPGASATPGIVGVAASTRQDTLAAFSSYGGQIALAAPGEQIVSAVPGGGYAAWSGTSMAAPFVSGVAALVRAHAPQLAPIEVIRRLTLSADRIDGPVRGRLNAAAALTMVDNRL